jgi:folylpolyglutamate synthase/dihydropteroate synthase
MIRCVEALGRPDRAFRTIHVTGTKGKGSVSRMLAALLRATGLRVGLYTSPHIERLCERIDVNGTPVSEQTFVEAFNELRPFLADTGKELTHFELLTAAAFCAFRAKHVDWAVIEVGIGGRPTVMIDGSHNAMAAASLSVIVRTVFEGRDRVLIVGIPRDKEVDQLIAHFADCGARRVIFTRYPGIRATAPEELAALWQRRSATPTEVIIEPEQAVTRALTIAGGDGVVVVTGSIHLAGILRPLIRARHHTMNPNETALRT